MIKLFSIISLFILYSIIGYTTCRIFLRRKTRHKRSKNPESKFTSPKAFRADRDWLESTGNDDVFISADDGIQLHARYIQNPLSSNRFVICCHGYRTNSASTASFAKLFYGFGYSILMPDARAHGKSGGTYIGMGWRDRFDLLKWISYVTARHPDADIVLFGVSMGGATVMNTVGEQLPPNVRCAIEDSGFVSICSEMVYQLAQRNLPKALLYTAVPFCKLLAGFSPLQDKDTVEALDRADIPMLFIHGTGDNFVPIEHLHRAVIAHHGKNSTLIVSNAGHADAILTDPSTYYNVVSEFINTFIS